MRLFELFRKNQEDEIDWVKVASNISGLLWTAMSTDLKMVANPYARIVLRADNSAFLTNDKHDSNHLLDSGDVSFASIREDSAALTKWIQEIKTNNESLTSQKIATEGFTKMLTRILMQTGRA